MPLSALRPAVCLELMLGDILVLLSDGICEYYDHHSEQFGEDRVEAFLRVHHGKRMAELSAVLLDAELLPTVDLTLEELFTNMVKYSPAGDAHVRIEIATAPRGVEVTLTDYDVDRFDVTRAPDADIDLPIEERRPGDWGCT
jgi:anti-sigma regulatory factor (Ser/Thr protein kinase)